MCQVFWCHVGLAMPGDMPEISLQGCVALDKRGVIPFQSKAEYVFAARGSWAGGLQQRTLHL